MSKDFVDDDLCHGGLRQISRAGRAVIGAAGSPAQLLIPAIPWGVFVHDHERKAHAVRAWIPIIVVAKIENFFIHGVIQADGLAAVIKAAGVNAADVESAAI